MKSGRWDSACQSRIRCPQRHSGGGKAYERARAYPSNWVGRRVVVFLEGDEPPLAGTLAGVGQDGIELAEEEHPDPYGEGAVEQGSPSFYGYDSVTGVRPAS